jgi:hypothetical protein
MGNQGFVLGLAGESLPIFNFAADLEPHCHDQGIQRETGEPPIPSSFCSTGTVKRGDPMNAPFCG